MRLRITAPDGAVSEKIASVAAIRLGREPGSEVCFDSDHFPMVSGRHARIERTSDRCLLTPLSQTNLTLLNDKPINGPVALRVGDRIRLGMNGPTVDVVSLAALPTPKPAAGRPHGEKGSGTVRASPEQIAEMRGSADVAHMRVGQGGIIGRSEGHVDFVLNHAHVSRRHARLLVHGKRVFLHDLGSSNGTFLNGALLTGQTELKQGDRIDIGPFALEFDGEALVGRSRSNNIELIARNIRRVVTNRATGEPLTLLDGIDLVVRPHEFACLLGPSGSGKSTLLSALSGRLTPNDGRVSVNGADLHANFGALKQDIAVVPQKDALHESLAVGQALWYTAKLRLPADTGAAEIEASLSEMLERVGLTERRATIIRHLSGGQIKRASLANEILSRPSLLFLDEVTSGLDEQTDREMMRLFRSLADAGKTVVCITHSLANVERNCHLVVILTAGGKLAFVGKPAEALRYFNIERLGDVYDRLAEQPAEHWQRTFRNSRHWQTYVADRLPPESAKLSGRPPRHEERTGHRIRLFLWQTYLLTRRYSAIWRGEFLSLVTMFGQALVVAALLGLLFNNLDRLQESLADAPEYARKSGMLMFLLAITSFWFGCNSAAKEIVKERLIYTRERDFNLLFASYYASKLILLTVFALSQTALLFFIVRWICVPPGSLWTELAVLLGLALAGVSLGLAISAFAATEEMAITLIPMAIIPQIILSGAIVPLGTAAKWLAMVTISVYWGKQGLDDCLSGHDAEAASSEAAIGVLLLHTCAGVTAALLLLYWQSRRARAPS